MQAHHGFIAGLSFAKDLLKACFKCVGSFPSHSRCRGGVDDMTLLVIGDRETETAMLPVVGLDTANAARRSDSMFLKGATSQVCRPSLET